MLIQLKQHEIEAAIRQYLVTEGINLTGKEISVQFSSTRNPVQVLAEVDITDPAHVTTSAAHLSVVRDPEPVQEEVPVAVAPEPETTESEEPTQEEQEEEEGAPKKRATSLFS